MTIAMVSVGQPRVSFGISIGSRLSFGRPLAIVVDGGDNGLAGDSLDNGVSVVAIAVVVETAIGQGEWDHGLLLAISCLHNLLGDHRVGVVGEGVGIGVASIAAVGEPRVSLGLSISSWLSLCLPLAIVVVEWVAISIAIVKWQNGLLLLSIDGLHLSSLDDWECVVGVVAAIGEAMGVGVASIDQVRVGVGLGGRKGSKRSNEESPDHPGRMVPC